METVCQRVTELLPDEVHLWLETAWGYRATRLLVGLALLQGLANIYQRHARRRRRSDERLCNI